MTEYIDVSSSVVVFRKEEKVTTVHNVSNLTLTVLVNFSLHSYKFSRPPTYFFLIMLISIRKALIDPMRALIYI